MGLELSIHLYMELSSDDLNNLINAGASAVEVENITYVEITIDEESNKDDIYNAEKRLMDKYPNESFDFHVTCRK